MRGKWFVDIEGHYYGRKKDKKMKIGLKKYKSLSGVWV